MIRSYGLCLAQTVFLLQYTGTPCPRTVTEFSVQKIPTHEK